MQRGKRLIPGDTIGIVAPAGAAAKDAILRGVRTLESLGYRVRLGESCCSHWYGFAGEDTHRAQDILNFFCDPSIDAILCMRGGYGTLRLLDQMDYNTLRMRPKVFIGYSDITLLHLVLNQRAKLITFHGPMLTSNFADDFDGETRDSFLKAVADGIAPYSIGNISGTPFRVMNAGIAEGVLLGGNLITLISTWGTPYEPDLTDKILFLEEIGEAAYRIDRALTQLLSSGKLKQIRGLILGDFSDCEPGSPEAMTWQDIIHDRLDSLDIPIVANLQTGHCRPMLTLPLGARVRIGDPADPVQILEPVVD